MLDYITYKELEVILDIDPKWYKDHLDEMSRLPYAEAYAKYPVEALKLAIRHKLGITEPGSEEWIGEPYKLQKQQESMPSDDVYRAMVKSI